MEIVLERAERKAETIRITWKDVFWLSANLVLRWVDHSADLDSDSGKRTWIDLYKECNSICDKRGGSFSFGAAACALKNSARYWKRKSVIAVTAILLAAGIEGLSILFSKAEGNR